MTDAKGNLGTVEYDSNNRVLKIFDPRSTVLKPIFAELKYPNSTETIFTDSNGIKTYYKNNSAENKPTVNVIQITEDYQGAQPSTTSYTWNQNTLTQVIEPNKADGTASGAKHTAQYNSKANLTEASSPGNLCLTNAYDDKSNLTNMDTLRTNHNNTYNAYGNLITSL